MINKRKVLALVAMAAGASTAVATAVPAQASPSGPPQLKVIKTISSAYVAPLQFAVAGRTILVADDATSSLYRVGDSTPLATNPGDGHEIAGVAIDQRTGAYAYSTATSVGEEGVHTAAALTIVRPGRPDQVVDLFKFETTHNPDRIYQYGVVGPVSPCVSAALTAAQIPVSYRGQVDTHPYGVVSLGRGAWAVADAGGNDVLRVNANGRVTTLAVLPPQILNVTAAFAAASGLPSCVIGVKYRVEAVPTDVEVGPRGRLFVTTLPGGEGVLGSVYKLASRTGYGTPTRVATGFNEATNLAIDRWGHMFVAELGSGDIAEVVHGKPVPVATVPDVVGVEYANGHLYASTSPAAATEGGPPPAPGSPPPGPGQILLLGR